MIKWDLIDFQSLSEVDKGGSTLSNFKSKDLESNGVLKPTKPDLINNLLENLFKLFPNFLHIQLKT